MSTYTANVTREGKWWMVAIPEIEGLTQARRLSEAALMAAEYVAVTLDVPTDDIDIDLHVTDVGKVDVAAALRKISDARREAERLEAGARLAASALARSLAAQGVPVRDIGSVMGVSFQRAHQLVQADLTPAPKRTSSKAVSRAATQLAHTTGKSRIKTLAKTPTSSTTTRARKKV